MSNAGRILATITMIAVSIVSIITQSAADVELHHRFNTAYGAPEGFPSGFDIADWSVGAGTLAYARYVYDPYSFTYFLARCMQCHATLRYTLYYNEMGYFSMLYYYELYSPVGTVVFRNMSVLDLVSVVSNRLVISARGAVRTFTHPTGASLGALEIIVTGTRTIIARYYACFPLDDPYCEYVCGTTITDITLTGTKYFAPVISVTLATIRIDNIIFYNTAGTLFADSLLTRLPLLGVETVTAVIVPTVYYVVNVSTSLFFTETVRRTVTTVVQIFYTVTETVTKTIKLFPTSIFPAPPRLDIDFRLSSVSFILVFGLLFALFVYMTTRVGWIRALFIVSVLLTAFSLTLLDSVELFIVGVLLAVLSLVLDRTM